MAGGNLKPQVKAYSFNTLIFIQWFFPKTKKLNPSKLNKTQKNTLKLFMLEYVEPHKVELFVPMSCMVALGFRSREKLSFCVQGCFFCQKFDN